MKLLKYQRNIVLILAFATFYSLIRGLGMLVWALDDFVLLTFTFAIVWQLCSKNNSTLTFERCKKKFAENEFVTYAYHSNALDDIVDKIYVKPESQMAWYNLDIESCFGSGVTSVTYEEYYSFACSHRKISELINILGNRESNKQIYDKIQLNDTDAMTAKIVCVMFAFVTLLLYSCIRFGDTNYNISAYYNDQHPNLYEEYVVGHSYYHYDDDKYNYYTY